MGHCEDDRMDRASAVHDEEAWASDHQAHTAY